MIECRPLRGGAAIARLELRCMRRGTRTWLLAFLALAAGWAAFLFYHHAAYQHYSVGHFSGNIVPGRFLMAGYAACFLLPLLAGVAFLAFDHRHRDQAAGVVETLDARPVSNLAFFVGRLMALAAAMWLLCAAFVVSMQAAGLAADNWLRSGAVDGWLGPLEPWSMAAFLFVDAPPALILWGALVLFLAAALRNRLAVVAVGLALLAGYGWLLLRAPLSLLPAVSILSGFEGFASDMLPRLPTLETVAQRGAQLALAAGLVALGARCCARTDQPSPWPVAAGLALVAIGASAVALLAQTAFAAEARRSAWLQAHAAYRHAPVPDLLRLSADVAIQPAKALRVDATLDLAVPTAPLAELVFSLNPGMRVEVLELDGHTQPHRHENGLLRIPAGEALAGTEVTLRVAASGLPDARFAYLDAIVNPLAVGVADGHFRILGTETMVFSDDYAVLLPGLKWLPTPGPNLDQVTPDFHHLDMQLTVPAGWRAVASGDRDEDSPSGGGQTLRFRSASAVPMVGVVAGRFDRYAAEVGGVEMELLLHPGHRRNAQFFAQDAQKLLSLQIGQRLAYAKTAGLGYPYRRFSVVEVPGRLRGFGGGWQLDTALALPGVALLREYGLPSMRLTMPPVHMVMFFMPADFSGGEPTIALWRSMTRFRTAAAGAQATLLNFLMDELAKGVSSAYWPGFFSAHHFDAAGREGMARQTLNRMMGHGTAVDHEVQGVAGRVAASPEFLANQLGELRFEDDPQGALELLNFKGRMLGRSLTAGWPFNGDAKLLGEMLRRHAGATYTLDDLRAAAEAVGAPLDSVLGEWWASAKLPGFVTSPLQILRLRDEGESPRYQLSLHVCNAEPVPGLVRLRCSGVDRVKQNCPLGTAPVQPNACVELGAVVDFPPVQAGLTTYLSRNGNGIALRVPDIDAARIVDAEPLQGARDSAWRLPPSHDVLVDDLSPGFALDDDAAPRGLRLLQRQLTWSRQEVSGAWGRYVRTAVISQPGEGDRSATFAASLPTAGRWRLQYHLPGAEVAEHKGGVGMSVRQVVAVHALGIYDMALVEHLESGDKHTRIEFDGSIAEEGWNHIGDFNLQSSRVSLVVTDRTDGDVVVADAIRWQLLRD